MKTTSEQELKDWLIEDGFTISKNHLASSYNECSWYAYRRSTIPARRCECNSDKEGVQIVITPHVDCQNRQIPTVTVDVTGQANGMWWTLSAYSIAFDEAINRATEIEASLVSAWNALHGSPVK